jgi:tRNA A-37 threonylcarbamoyl transferase component Bud32
MPAPSQSDHDEAHKAYFRDILAGIRTVMADRYGLSGVSIRPIRTGGSRLSIPIRITGTDAKGPKVLYFGKILGSSDLTVAASIQFFKNIYLNLNAQDPMFEASRSAEAMARDQYEMLKKIHELGVPTARPFGYHRIDGGLWLVVAEFLDATPMADSGKVTPEQVRTIFGYLKKMHRNGVFHGDLKPENIMLGDRIYILDVGRFRDGVRKERKRAYDLACLICSLLECLSPEKLAAIARKHYSRSDIRAAAGYLDLVQRRPDINFSDDTKMALRKLMAG